MDHNAHIAPWVRTTMRDRGISMWDWSDAEVLDWYQRTLDGKTSWRRN